MSKIDHTKKTIQTIEANKRAYKKQVQVIQHPGLFQYNFNLIILYFLKYQCGTMQYP